MTHAMLALRLVWLAALLVVALTVHAMFRVMGAASPAPRWFLRHAARASGFRVVIEGRPLGAHVLFAANHISWTDILALGGATGCAFVTKAEVAGWPLLGWLARQNGSLFVERQRRGAVVAQGAALRDALARARPVTLFAEGTTGNGLSLLPFRPALFETCVPPPPGVRVQPVGIDYGADASTVAWVDDEPLGHHAARLLACWAVRPVTLRFGDPIDPAGHDRKSLASACRASVQSLLALDDGRAPSGGQGAHPSA